MPMKDWTPHYYPMRSSDKPWVLAKDCEGTDLYEIRKAPNGRSYRYRTKSAAARAAFKVNEAEKG